MDVKWKTQEIKLKHHFTETISQISRIDKKYFGIMSGLVSLNITLILVLILVLHLC